MAKYTRILSLDGGGLRGIIPAQILKAVEQKLQDFTGNIDAKIVDYFDLIAGTSAGGILTCLYLYPDSENPTRPRYSAQDAYNFLRNHGSQIFQSSKEDAWKNPGGLIDEKYSEKAFEQLARDVFQNLKLSELLKPCLITSYDIERRKALFFTQHNAKLNVSADYFVRDVLRATSAAPTFFEVAQIQALDQEYYTCIDGGVFANNPALCAYAEARHTFNREFNIDHRYETGPTAKEMVILSLGTGDIKKKYFYEEAKDWGKIQWLNPLFDIIMTAGAETVDYQMKQMFDAINKPDQYLRIDPVLSDKRVLPMDDASESNLKAISELGEQLAEGNSQKLDDWVQFLLV